jgi:exodeoxyribonuclease V gamma subunit
MRLILSHKLEELADALIANLIGSQTHPLARKLVIVPSLKLKEYLQFYSAQHQQVFFGTEILTLPEAWRNLFDLEEGRSFPSFLELSLEIERQILKHHEHPRLKPLMGVLQERRHYPKVCDDLSKIFTHYGTFGEEFLPAWKQEAGWQQFLWENLFSEETGYTTLCEQIQKGFSCKDPIYLFGVNYLPKNVLECFKRCDAEFYLFSPCALFWEDLCSDRERIQLEKHVSPQQRMELSNYLKQTNPLLANWGRMNRSFLSLLGDDFESEENYEHEESSLLTAVQQDLLEMRNPAEGEKKEWDISDGTIQIQGAASRLQEVEALFETICELMAADPTLKPDQIAVFAPDICAYAPYIHLVFGGENRPFDYAISDLEEAFQNPFFQAVHDLIQLPKKRFSPAAVMKLFSYDFFLQKWGFAPEDVEVIRKWIQKVGITWGIDAEQRSQFLSTMNPEFVASEAGTWKQGLRRLAWGLVTVDEEWAEPAVESSEMETLGKWMQLISSMERDLSFLFSGKEQTVGEWLLAFEQLLITYFAGAEEQALLVELSDMRKRLSHLSDVQYPIGSIERVLASVMQKKNGVFQTGNLCCVRFASLRTGAVTPAPVIALLGMEEGNFPRDQKWGSLYAMKEGKHNPSKSDEDRALFLQTLLSARTHLILSYQRINAEDGKEQHPSLLIQELLSYLDSAYQGHPSKGIQTCSASPRRFFTTEKREKREEERKIISLPSSSLFSLPSVVKNLQLESNKPDEVISIRELGLLARHPIRFYLNRALGIYIHSEEEDPTSREFILSALDRSQIRKAACQSDVSTVLSAAEKQGKLPSGVFQEVATKRIQEEVDLFHEHLKSFNVSQDDLFSVELSFACTEPRQVGEKLFLFPPLTLSLSDGQEVHLIGSLPDISKQGLLFHGTDNLKDLMKVWPLYLVFLNLELPCAKNLLLTKSGTVWTLPHSDPRQLLVNYLEYYQRSLKEMSALMPDWAEGILKGAAMSNSFTLPYVDPYLEWLAMRPETPLATEVWASELKKWFPEEVWHASV